jgi:UDP-glucose 4-epimerase
VHVHDVARANVLALEGDAPSEAYNVGTGVETSVNELYDLLRQASGNDLPREHAPARPGEQSRSSVNPALAARALGWRPDVELAAGLQQTFRYFAAL